MSETRSRHVKTTNNSVSLNNSARKPRLCLTVQKVQLLEILHSPESRLSAEMCKRSYEALTLKHREHISHESSVYTRGISQNISIPAKSCKLRADLKVTPQLTVTTAQNNSQISLARANVYCNQMFFIGFLFMTWHCCHKSNSCWIYNLSLFTSEELLMVIHF